MEGGESHWFRSKNGGLTNDINDTNDTNEQWILMV